MTLSSGTQLGPYEVISPLGAGGMGEVYLAKDSKLDRKVAIKVLPADVASSPERLQRFEREAKTVATLNHPNIVTIHGIHNEDDYRFIAMELVEGETLDRMIAPGGMPLAKIFDIAIPLADALAAAHDKGIVHRDLKPGNVMVTQEGRVKVLDFGLAKLTAAGKGGSSPDDVTMSAPLTGRGMIIGTVPYMSPEQLQGETVDHRTDLFSLGIMLYEMAAGQRPFHGKTSASITSSILRDTPRPLHELNGVLPRHLGRIIQHCLEKDPEQRFQSAKDVRNELRALRKEVDSGNEFAEPVSVSTTASQPPSSTSSIPSGSALSAPTRRGEFWVGVGVIGIILIAGFWFMRSRNELSTSPALTRRSTDSAAIDSLAVLPLANLSGDPEQEYFADGMTEALITNLARIKALRVISRTSAMRYKGTDKSLPQIARELNVSGIVEGSVILSGDRVRVTAQLIHAASDTHLWADSYTRHLRDILSLQNDVARAIAQEIEVAVTPEEQTRFARARTVNPEAYHDYIMGRYHWNKFNEQDFKTALGYFQQAIEHDPTYAAAYAGLSDSYGILAHTGSLAPHEAFPKAKSFIQKALELDETLADAHSSLGAILITYDWNWAAAEEEFQRAIQLEPGNANAHHWYASLVLTTLGRFNDAHAEIERAKELDPLSLLVNNAMGWIYYSEGQYDKAIDVATETLKMQSAFSSGHVLLGATYTEKGMYYKAIEAYQEAMTLSSRHPRLLASLGRTYALAGRREPALALLEELTARSKETYVPAFSMAIIYVGLGEKNRVFEWLERAYVERSNILTRLNLLPAFNSLHGDPRFDELLNRIGFPSDPPARVVEPWKRQQIRLAVLPFANLSGDPEQEYFSDGMTEEMITRLGRLRPELLGVIARTSAMRYKNTNKTIDEIGRELNVAYVIEGGVRRSGNSVRINAQLIQVSDQTQLWGDSYTRDLSDVFAIQEEVADAVAKSLAVELLPQDKIAQVEPPTASSAAHNAYLLGRHYWAKRTPEALYTAIEHFKRAVKLDPNYALAYSGLADAWGVLPWYVPGPYNQINAEAKEAAKRALALNDSLAEVHVSAAVVLTNSGNLEAAEQHYLRAIVLDPNNATAHQWYGLNLTISGHYEEAVQEFEKAITLDPLSAVMHHEYGAGMVVARRFDKAIEQLKKALDLQPDRLNAAYDLMWVYIGRGDQDAAAASFENYLTLLGQPANRVETFHRTYGTSGLRSAILGWLASFGSGVQTPGFGYPTIHASLLAWCDEKDRAFEWLGRAVEQQDPYLIFVASHPAFDNLRDDPRFDVLLRKMGLRKIDLPPPPTTP